MKYNYYYVFNLNLKSDNVLKLNNLNQLSNGFLNFDGQPRR